MCGLFGEIGLGALDDAQTLSRISQTIRHRGPDDDGSAMGQGWMLGFRRLAILDLSADGHQPMRSADGRYIIVFNGEIYNYVELKRELEDLGEVFSSGTDTEVLLRLLIREGPEALQKCNGMFAFAFLDLQERRYLIARDRLGVKPLYLRLGDGKLRFASELKALLEWPDAPREIDRDAVRDYLSLGYVPGDACIFQGYCKLPPGHYAEGEMDRPSFAPRRYWAVKVEPDTSSNQDDDALLAQFEALLADAVKLRMRSDVPVALLLSGGIDSGLVAAFMAASGTKPVALVASFDNPEFDEAGLATETARHLDMPVEVLALSSANLADVDRLAAIFDEPFGDASALPMSLICEAARQHAIVLLTGDGGDEACGGYRRYIEAQNYRGLMAVPNWLRRLVWKLARGRVPQALEYKLAKATLPDESLASVFDGLGHLSDPALALILPEAREPSKAAIVRSVARVWEQSRGRDLLSRQRQFDYGHYLPDDILVKVDRSSMAFSTEVRSPFLDYRVIEFAARLPKRVLLRSGEGKLLLRRLAQRLLPQSVAVGGKKGFGVPVGDWVKQPEGQAFVRSRLMDPARNWLNLWRVDGVEMLLQHHLAGRRDYGNYFWRLLMLEAWMRQYLPEETT